MKNIIFTLTILFFNSFTIFAQAPNFLWAQGAGSANSEYAKSTATDAAGNVYVTGIYNSPSITFGTTTLTNAGLYDMFIVKYDASGNVLWVKGAGGTGNDYGLSIITDVTGNVYLTGWYNSPSITFGTFTLSNAAFADMYIVKYDASGNLIWANDAGGIGNDYGASIALDATGNVYVTGYFGSPTLTFGSTTLNSLGLTDMFIVKYDASGNVLWANNAGGTANDYGLSTNTDMDGNVFVTGTFLSSSFSAETTSLTNAGNTDVFVVKYNSSGALLWAKGFGGTAGDFGAISTTDMAGNLYVTGNYESPFISFGAVTITNAGNQDIYIVKYDPSGNVLWAKSEGNTDGDFGNSITRDGLDNIYVIGWYNSLAITFGATTLNNTGAHDMFITKYDASGNVIWAKNAGGTDDDFGANITIDALPTLYLIKFAIKSLPLKKPVIYIQRT